MDSRHVKSEMPNRHSRRDVSLIFGFVTWMLREKLKLEIKSKSLQEQMILKAKSLNKITKVVNIDTGLY